MKHRSLGLTLLLCLIMLAALGRGPASANAMTVRLSLASADITALFYTDLFSRGDLAVASEIVESDAVFMTPEGVLVGPHAFAGFVQRFRTAFPDAEFIVGKSTVAEETTSVMTSVGSEYGANTRIAVEKTTAVFTIQWTMIATHQGTFLGHPATGTQVELPGITILEVEDDQITAGWLAYDQLALVDQIITPQAPEGVDMPDPVQPRSLEEQAPAAPARNELPDPEQPR